MEQQDEKLNRKVGELIQIGDAIKITGLNDNYVRINFRIEAPDDIKSGGKRFIKRSGG